jgi:hypothetical protein
MGFDDQRILGVQSSVSAVPGQANGNVASNGGRLAKGDHVDSGQLEDSDHSSRNIEYLDVRRIREIAERIEGGTAGQKLSRYGIAALAIWAAVATIYAVMLWSTVSQLSSTINEIQQTVNEAKLR